MVITFSKLLEAAHKNKLSEDILICINNQPVWDFKALNGTLRLIHEPVSGSENYEQVSLRELKENLTEEEIQLPIVSETLDGYGIVDMDVVEAGTQDYLRIKMEKL